MNILSCLKWAQLFLAVSIGFAIEAVFFPSLEAILLLPICGLYIFWSARSIKNHRFSMWMACTCSLTAAVLLGALVTTNGFFQSHERSGNMAAQQSVVAIANGEVKVIDHLSIEAKTAFQKP